ncbi:MAG TPA: aminomethyltransferase family protein, partial [Gemmataceae bacterium]|nr:aminomethyltransferase family protein [Gemmataceae bacterium]
MLDRTALHDSTAGAGAVFAEDYGWLVPLHFGDVQAEYFAARKYAALFDVSHHVKVELSGADAGKFLHNLCTNDIVRLGAGAGCEAFLTTGQAKIVAHACVYRQAHSEGGDTFWLDVGPGLAENVLKHLDRFIISEQVELADRTREFAQVHLAGPEAAGVLQRVGAEEAGKLQDLQQTEHGLGAGSRCRIRRHDPLGVLGYDIVCPVSDAAAVWQSLTAAGARPAGAKAYHILRIEAGTPINGVDIDETNLPQEVGRTERTVSFTKGCYIGQETIARIRTYGHVNRSLVRLVIAGDGVVPHGSKLYRDGKEVGLVTSSTVS